MLIGCNDATSNIDEEAIAQEIKSSVERSLVVNPSMTGNVDFSDERESKLSE